MAKRASELDLKQPDSKIPKLNTPITVSEAVSKKWYYRIYTTCRIEKEVENDNKPSYFGYRVKFIKQKSFDDKSFATLTNALEYFNINIKNYIFPYLKECIFDESRIEVALKENNNKIILNNVDFSDIKYVLAKIEIH
jgi:hypothetical protein